MVCSTYKCFLHAVEGSKVQVAAVHVRSAPVMSNHVFASWAGQGA